MLTNAVVLLKQVLDPELPASRFRIDEDRKAPPPDLGAELLGPFEQSALEVALQLKDAGLAQRVTAVLVGAPSCEETLRKALAVRADEAVRVDPETDEHLDASQTAALLVRCLRGLESVDLVLAGRQAGDWDQGQVGYLVAERLGWPCVGLVQRVDGDDGALTATRQFAGAEEVLSVSPPAVLTVNNADGNRLRMAKVMDLMAARREPLTELGLEELELDRAGLEAERRTERVDVWVPAQTRECRFVEGEDAAEVASALVDRLQALKLLGGAS